MTRTKWCKKLEATWVIRSTTFGFTVIVSLVMVLGLWQTAHRIFGQASAYAGQTAPLRLEVGQVQPLAVEPQRVQLSEKEEVKDTAVELVVRVNPKLNKDITDVRQVVDNSEVPVPSSGEVWIEGNDLEEQSDDRQVVLREPASEIWLEKAATDEQLPIVSEVPAPPKPDLARTDPVVGDRSSNPENCRIVLGASEGTSLRIKRPYLIYPAATSMAEQPLAKEPPLPSPWLGTLAIPETTPQVIRKVRESLELNQALTVGGMGTVLGRNQLRKELFTIQAELSPEPVRHHDVTLTSAESAVGAVQPRKELAGEGTVTGWEFPGRVSPASKPEAMQVAISSADAPSRQENRLPQNESPWKLMPIERPVGSDASNDGVWDQRSQRADVVSVETPQVSPQSAAERKVEDRSSVRPLITSEESALSEDTTIKVTEFANQAIPRSPTMFVAQENETRPEQTSVAVASGNPQIEEPSFEVIEESGELTVIVRRSKLLRTKVDVYRTAVVDSGICDVVQFTPREISILGKSQGATHVTFWFQDERYRPITYLVRVIPDPEVEKQQSERYELLESHLAKLFPESKVDLLVVGDKLLVRGQARDAAEAAHIMAIIRGELVRARGVTEGEASDPIGREAAGQALPAIQVINMLRIPGPPQVALKVKIAELNRSAARNFGVDMKLNFDQGKFLIQSLLSLSSGGSASILGNFDGGDLKFGLHYLEEHGVVRLLSEPTLITLSGRPATFIAGGEFAVPTTVGVNGVGAVTTDFRAYGAIITFLPTVLDKDLIRLEVAPEFSQLDTKNKVNGTPGLRTRAVTTTVEMREGQTLAIAGLLDDSMTGNNQGDLPIFNQIFGQRSSTRNETELIILVTPELVHPMEPEEVPPLPGFDVTEPTNHEFYIKGHLEGRPTQEYDSTTWPRLRRRYNAGGPAKISGPFGHGD
ncbi:MAG: type II and III secretion system protein family protein [Thermogutta sp.]